jgi:hypothetical protein
MMRSLTRGGLRTKLLQRKVVPKEGYRIVKGFNEPSGVGNTSFTVSMAMLSDEKGDENTPENEGTGGHGLFGVEDQSNEIQNVKELGETKQRNLETMMTDSNLRDLRRCNTEAKGLKGELQKVI